MFQNSYFLNNFANHVFNGSLSFWTLDQGFGFDSLIKNLFISVVEVSQILKDFNNFKVYKLNKIFGEKKQKIFNNWQSHEKRTLKFCGVRSHQGNIVENN